MRRAAVLLVAGLAACGSAPERRPPSGEVARAVAASSSGDLAQAERELAPLFVDDVPEARRGEVFWAGFVLARAHARAALGAGGDAGPGGGGARASHAQAALYYADRARRALESSGERPPAELDDAGTRDEAALALDLLELSLQGLLGFDERVARMVQANAELLRPGGAERLAREARLDAPLEARLDLTLWEHWAPRDERRAFDLAVRTLTASDAAAAPLAPRDVARVEAWLRRDGRFRCPECRQAAVPELRACPNDQTPLARFRRDA